MGQIVRKQKGQGNKAKQAEIKLKEQEEKAREEEIKIEEQKKKDMEEEISRKEKRKSEVRRFLLSALENYLLDAFFYLDCNKPKIVKSCSQPVIRANQEYVLEVEIESIPNLSSSNVHQGEVGKVADGRKRVHNTTEWPYSAHGVVLGSFNGENYRGSGTLIGPNVVITAAHNVYDYKNHTEPDKVYFIPAMNETVAPFGICEVTSFFSSNDYKRNGSGDYAILILDKLIGEKTGYFGIAALHPEEILQKKINVTGYPFDKVKTNPSNIYEMWTMGSKPYDIENGQIKYRIDSSRGQNGSGVWYEVGESYYIVGIHVAESRAVNCATLITQEVLKDIVEGCIRELKKDIARRIDSFQAVPIQKLDMNENIAIELAEALEVSKDLIYNVEVLKASKAGINDRMVEMFCKCNWPGLRNLNWTWNQITDAGSLHISKANWPNLEKLDLSKNQVSGLHLPQANWQNLQYLNLSYNKISDSEALALSQAPWPNLRDLELGCNKITDAGISYLAQAWPKLEQINLWQQSNKITHVGAFNLSKAIWLNLRTLSIGDNKISDAGVMNLIQASWPNLQNLYMGLNQITDAGALHISRANWENLQELVLKSNQISDNGAVHLCQANWRNLRQLDLWDNKITDDGALRLAKAKWPNLQYLNVAKNQVTSEGVLQLHQILSNRVYT